ncbi:pyocin S6 family toxin immunity protein [Pseudomonas sp. GG8]
MYLCISGFLPDNAEDDSLKFELDLDGSFNEQIVQLLAHRSINAMAEGEWLLASEQVAQISSIIGHSLPTNLKLFIGVEA